MSTVSSMFYFCSELTYFDQFFFPTNRFRCPSKHCFRDFLESWFNSCCRAIYAFLRFGAEFK